jgi:hypothetical protein
VSPLLSGDPPVLIHPLSDILVTVAEKWLRLACKEDYGYLMMFGQLNFMVRSHPRQVQHVLIILLSSTR